MATTKKPKLTPEMQEALRENLKSLQIPPNHRGGGGLVGNAERGKKVIEESRQKAEAYKKKHGYYPWEEPGMADY